MVKFIRAHIRSPYMEYLIKSTRTHAHSKIDKKNRWKIHKFRNGSWEMFKRLGAANTKNTYEQDYLFSVVAAAANSVLNSIALFTKPKNFQFYYIKWSRDKDRMCAAERTCYVSSGNCHVYFHRAPNSLFRERGRERNKAWWENWFFILWILMKIHVTFQFTLFCPTA